MKSKFALSTLIITIALVSCINKKEENLKKTFFRMDTVTEITLAVPGSYKVEPIWNSLDSIMKDWEERFSETNPKSEVLTINKRTSDTVVVSKEFSEMLRTALRMADSTEGYFDVTILPIKEMWGLGEEEDDTMPIPSADSVAKVLKNVGYKKVHMSPIGDTVFFNSLNVKIDLGGVAKGYVIREVGRYLDRNGISNYLINAGGDILSRGKRADGKSWVIGLQHPRGREKILAIVSLDSGSIVTSGDYEHFRIVNGKRIHHIFNPFTGFSCLNNTSLTIWSMNTVEGKILCTGLFCRDAKGILSYVNSRPGLECIVVDSSGAVFVSDRWKNNVQIEK